ncbi:MAG: DUF3095 domain-containing protein [Methylococcaceae bacterium]
MYLLFAMATNEDFYSKLKPFDQFEGICDLSNYTKLPQDWAVVISDIKGSTSAIQDGKYRQVNAIGVASIVAVLNAVKPLPIPFVFGGDGATFCIPNRYINDVKKALVATKLMAEKQFSLSLRWGIVPCPIIHQSKHQVLIAKHHVSKGYYQTAFTGKGLIYAEDLVKNDRQGLYSIIPNNLPADADFTGFECRWKDIPSLHDETISLLVMSIANTTEQSNSVYLNVMETIQQVYGNVESHRPVQKETLELTTQTQDLTDEITIRTTSHSKLERILYAWLLPWKVRLGRYWMNTNKQAINTDWGEYKETLVTHTDFRKFDDNLRMVISGNADQRIKLKHYLEKQYQNGLLVYGIHVSNRALMTCVISDYNLNHIHFVDGADGGYAMAAKTMKQQLNTAKNSP